MHNVDNQAAEAIRAALPDDGQLIALAEVFKLLCDPTRLRILHVLREMELCVHDLASLIDSSESNTSHQLRILRNSNLVKYRKQGKQVFYSIADHHITHLMDDLQMHLGEER